LSAATGTEAMERIEQERPDIVVCDVILPDKDGYKVCEFVRAHPDMARTPVLLISGVVNSTVLARAAEVQSNDVMFKPFAAEELVRKIEGLLGARATAALAPSAPRPTGVTSVPSIERVPASPPVAAGVAVAPAPSRPEAHGVGTEPAPADDAPEASTGNDLKARLEALCATPGVRLAALADREGFLIEAAGDLALDAEVAAALSACVAESSDGIGRDLKQ